MASKNRTVERRVRKQRLQAESAKDELEKALEKIQELESSVEREKKLRREKSKEKEDEIVRLRDETDRAKAHAKGQAVKVALQETKIANLEAELSSKLNLAVALECMSLDTQTKISAFKSKLTGIIRHAQNPSNLPGIWKRKKFFLDALSEVHSLAAKELPCKPES